MNNNNPDYIFSFTYDPQYLHFDTY